MSNGKVNIRLLTPEFRMSFANVIEAKPFMENGRAKGAPSFNLNMVFNPDDLKKFKRDNEKGEMVDCDLALVAVEIAKQAWPNINPKETFIPGKNWFIKNGDTMAAAAEAKKKDGSVTKGKKVIWAKAYENYPPRLRVRENGKSRDLNRALSDDLAKAKSLFYSGAYAFAEINLQTSEVSGTKYIVPYLNAVLFSRPGERIGGGESMMDRFDGVYGGAADYDPTAGQGAGDTIPG